jgi:hypothetical protein
LFCKQVARETLKSIFILRFVGNAPQKDHWRVLQPVLIEGAVRADGATAIVLRFAKNQRKRMGQIRKFVEDYNFIATEENKVTLFNDLDSEESIVASSDDAPYVDNDTYRFVRSQEGKSRFVWAFADN